MTWYLQFKFRADPDSTQGLPIKNLGSSLCWSFANWGFIIL